MFIISHKVFPVLLATFLILAACRQNASTRTQEEAASLERRALVDRVDSLLQQVDEESRQLKLRMGASGTADHSGLGWRLVLLDKVRSRLAARRDEIRVDQLEEWYYFRDRMRDSLRLIEDQLKADGNRSSYGSSTNKQ